MYPLLSNTVNRHVARRHDTSGCRPSCLVCLDILTLCLDHTMVQGPRLSVIDTHQPLVVNNIHHLVLYKISRAGVDSRFCARLVGSIDKSRNGSARQHCDKNCQSIVGRLACLVCCTYNIFCGMVTQIKTSQARLLAKINFYSTMRLLRPSSGTSVETYCSNSESKNAVH